VLADRLARAGLIRDKGQIVSTMPDSPTNYSLNALVRSNDGEGLFVKVCKDDSSIADFQRDLRMLEYLQGTGICPELVRANLALRYYATRMVRILRGKLASDVGRIGSVIQKFRTCVSPEWFGYSQLVDRWLSAYSALPLRIQRTFSDAVSYFRNNLPKSTDTLVPCHNDFHSGNVLVGEFGIAIIDFDHVGMNRVGVDLACLSLSCRLVRSEEDRLAACADTSLQKLQGEKAFVLSQYAISTLSHIRRPKDLNIDQTGVMGPFGWEPGGNLDQQRYMLAHGFLRGFSCAR
jgi:thiamine kinase-like enzyme